MFRLLGVLRIECGKCGVAPPLPKRSSTFARRLRKLHPMRRMQVFLAVQIFRRHFPSLDLAVPKANHCRGLTLACWHSSETASPIAALWFHFSVRYPWISSQILTLQFPVTCAGGAPLNGTD